jgi:hypothetical protein
VSGMIGAVLKILRRRLYIYTAAESKPHAGRTDTARWGVPVPARR